MAKATAQLKKALSVYFRTNVLCANLRTLLTSNGKLNIYADNAIECRHPYMVYTIPSNGFNYTLANGNMDYINLQISIYNQNPSLGSIEAIAIELEDVMDGYILSLDSGYTCFCNQLQSSFELFPDKESCQIVQRYKVGISYQVGT